ncbi:MAG: hypothetical protein QOF35_2259 [Actinomycetota bacterium]|nr:hypothetical protein [Actinomycetota bacterium]
MNPLRSDWRSLAGAWLGGCVLPSVTSAYKSLRTSATAGRRLPALDGLRGVAVLGVLLFHGGVSWVRGGFLGVDAFFVLSGFLITGLLLTEWETRTAGGLRGAIDLLGFWGRRARRLLPALLVLVGAMVMTAALSPELRAQPGLQGDIWSTIGYVANWHLILAGGGDYFTRTGPPSPLQHTWSLAIEEQFYLLWPLIVVLVLRLSKGRVALRSVALAGAALSAVLMAWLSASATGMYDRVYYGTDTRAQSLLIGAALVTVIPLGRQSATFGVRGARWTGWLGLGVSAWLWATADGSDPAFYLGGFTLAAVAVAGVIWAALVDKAGPIARTLGLLPLRGLGVISYGVYLWHWPLFLALTAERTGQHGPTLLALRIAATLAVATMSYVFVEQPIRSRRMLQRRRAPVLTTTAAMLAALTLGALQPAVTHPVRVRPLPTVRFADGPTASRGTPGSAVPRRSHSGPTRLLVLGDSVAETLFKGMPHYPRVAVSNHAVLGCGLLQQSPYRYAGEIAEVPTECAGWPENWSADVRRNDPDVVALLVGRWEVMDRVIDGSWQSVGDPALDRQVLSNLERILPMLTAKGARLALLTPPYYHRFERPDGGLWPEDRPKRVDRFTGLLRQFAAKHPDRVSVVELGKLMNPRGRHRYSAYISGVFARYDGVHLTPEAAALLAPKLLPQLIALDSRAGRT